MAQHDYVLANASGVTVRGDMNDALAAIVSLNSGATEPSTTFAYQLWMDTNTSTLKRRNASNDGWDSLYSVIKELATDSTTGAASFDSDDFTVAAGDVTLNKAMKTAATGVFRRAYLLIEDGTNASTLKCSVVAGWNGDTIAAEDNLAKGGNTTSFELNANGASLYIYGAALTGTLYDAGFLGYFPNGAVVGSTVYPWMNGAGSSVPFNFRSSAGAVVDMTSEIGTGTIKIEFYYITSE